MSAGTSLALEKAPRRAFPRFPVKVPLDVIALRSGFPQNLPGRCTDVSEGGVGAMVAGELAAGQQIAVEFRLPNVGPLRARALVRYQDKVRCGFEFVGLAAEHREMIRYWSHRVTTGAAAAVLEGAKPAAGAHQHRDAHSPFTEGAEDSYPATRIELAHPCHASAGRAWLVAVAVVVERTGERSGKPDRTGASLPEIMAARIVSKSEPVYPEEARRTGTQGLVVLDVLIGADGTVRHLQPASGNAVLAKSAIDAVQQWKFEPYRSSGRALEVETSIAVEFRLN